MNTLRHPFWFFALFLAGLSALRAQTFNWTGTTDGNWALSGNWSEGAVTGGDTTALVFGDTLRLATTNTVAGGLTLNSLTFTAAAGGYTVSGTPLIFSGIAPTLSSFSTDIADITISAEIQLASTLTVSGDAGDFGGQLKFTGGMSGAGGLVWASGVGVLAGTNTYSGGTTISGGAFAISTNSGLGTGAVVVNGGALQLQNNITVTNALTLAGSGSESLPALHSSTGSNTWSGAVTLADDTVVGSFLSEGASFSSLRLSGALALQGHTLTVNARQDSTTTLQGVISGTGGILKTGAGAMLLGGSGNTFTGDIRVEAGSLVFTSGSDNLGNAANTLTMVAGTSLVSGTGTPVGNRSVVLEGTGFVTVDSNSFTTYAANFSGTAGLILSGGIFELVGNNTFSGGLKVGAGTGLGTLNFSETTSLGAAGNVVTVDAGRINFTPAGSALTVAASQPLVIATAGGTLGAEAGKTITVASAISGDGKLNLRGLTDNVNGGTFVLTGANSHAGGVLVSRTTLAVGSDAALGAAGGVLDLAGGTLRATDSFTVAATRSTAITNSSTVDTQGFTLTFAQALGGSGFLTKMGSGELVLGATSTASHIISLNEGGLTTSAVNALGTGNVSLSSGTVLTLGANQQLDTLSGSGTVVTQTGRTLELTGTGHYFNGAITGGALIALTGANASFGFSTAPANDFSLRGGQLFARSDSTIGATQTIEVTAAGGRLAAQDYNTLTVDGVISGAGALTIASLNSDFSPSNDGIIALNGSNTYAGGTVVVGGRLVVGSDAALGTGALTLQGGALVAAGARTLSQNVTVGAPAGFYTTRIEGDAMTFNGNWTLTGDRELMIENTTTLNGDLQGGAVGFTKSGYGALLFNGASTLAGDVVVQSGVFGGNGSLAGNLVVQSYATLAPGMSAGLMTITGDLTLLGQSITQIEIGGLTRGVGGYDAFDIGGTLLADGLLEVSLINGFALVGGETFLIFDAGMYSGSFSEFMLPTLGDGLFWDTTQLATSGVLSVTGAAAIPEPSTWAALLGVGSLLLVFSRRRRGA